MADYTDIAFPEPTVSAHAVDDVSVEVIGVITGPQVLPPDTTPPNVSFVSPMPGSTLNVNDAVTFDVTDNLGEFRRVIVEALFQSTGQSEVVHDGDAFRPYYSGSSTRSVISLGYRYVLRRLGGWPSSPTIRVYAIDQDGNEGE